MLSSGHYFITLNLVVVRVLLLGEGLFRFRGEWKGDFISNRII